MNSRTIFFALTCLGTPTLLLACSDDDDGATTAPTTTTATTGVGGMGGDGGTGGDGGAGATGGGGAAPTGRVRVAHLSPDAPPVDFCVDPGTGFIGPVMGAVVGDADGLAYSEVTDYLELPAATYDVRLVAPGAADCDTPLGPPDTTGVTLPANIDATVAAIGLLAPSGGAAAFALQVYVDDNSAPPAGEAKLRFIHASPDTPAVDVGTGSEAGDDFAVVWDNVSFPDVGLVNGEEYLVTPPLTDVTVSAQANDSGVDALVIPGVTLPANAIATAFAIGNLGGDPEPLSVLVCVDNAPTSTCVVLP